MNESSALEPAICTEIAPDEYLWEGEANGRAIGWIVKNPDITLYMRPILSAYVLGVQLVDQEGAVYTQNIVHRGRGGIGL